MTFLHHFPKSASEKTAAALYFTCLASHFLASLTHLVRKCRHHCAITVATCSFGMFLDVLGGTPHITTPHICQRWLARTAMRTSGVQCACSEAQLLQLLAQRLHSENKCIIFVNNKSDIIKRGTYGNTGTHVFEFLT